MSLDIRNGYRLDVRRSRANEHSFESVSDVVNAFKQQARPIAQTLVNRRAAYLCARVIDQRVLEVRAPIDGMDVPAEWSPLEAALSILLDRYGQTVDGDRPSPAYAFDAHLTIIPAGGEVLALLWAYDPGFFRVWEETEGVVPFPYWESEERPLDITEEEWSIRESIWLDACSNGDDPWCVTGYTTEVLGRWGMPVPHIDGVMAYIPPRHERALLYAMDRVLRRRLKKNAGSDELTRMIAFDSALRHFRGTREGNAELQCEREDIEAVLPAISASMLVHEQEKPERPQ